MAMKAAAAEVKKDAEVLAEVKKKTKRVSLAVTFNQELDLESVLRPTEKKRRERKKR